MFGHGMMNPGNWGVWGTQGGRLFREGGHHLGGFRVAGGVLGLILWIAVMIALVLLIMTLIRGWRRPYGPTSVLAPATPAEPAAPSADSVRILEERYARGEINHEEYLERRKDLTGN